jgi:GntR family transcriptional regulator
VALSEGLVFQDEAKIGLSVSYVGLTVEEAEAIGSNSPDPISLLERVLQVSIGDAETTVATVTADAQSAEFLGIAEGTPMLWLEDLLRDVQGRPRAISQLRYRGDRVAFSATARRPTIVS